MNKIIPFMIVLACLISCGQGTTQTAQPITITVKSQSGFTKNVINAETQQLMSAETMNYETGAKTNREYTYNRVGEPASIIVDDQAMGSIQCIIPKMSSLAESVMSMESRTFGVL